MEYVIWKIQQVNSSKQAAVILIRDNADVVQNEVILPAGSDFDAHITANLTDLFNGGVVPTQAEVSPLALFNAVKLKQARALHLKVIFDAFAQLKAGGGAVEMVTAARAAYALDDELLAEANAFEAAYKAADEDTQKSLSAFAIFSVGVLISSDRA